MEINNKTILKAKAYDLIASIDTAREMLAQINQQIVQLQLAESKKVEDKPKKVEKKE